MAKFGIASLVAITAGGNQPKAGLAAFYSKLVTIGNNLLIPLLILLTALEVCCRKLGWGKNPKHPTDPIQV